jgi:hypothetical protein
VAAGRQIRRAAAALVHVRSVNHSQCA